MVPSCWSQERWEVSGPMVDEQCTALYSQSLGDRGRGGDSEEGMCDSKGVCEERHIWLRCTHYTGGGCTNVNSVSLLRA